MRKKQKLVIAPKCDYCGQNSETFVCTADHKTFCRIQYVGHPPIKDCMTDYYKEKNNVQKEKSKKSEKEEQEEKVLTDRQTAIKKLAELKQFLSKKKQASI